eukprot:g17713.t1
MFPVLEVLLVRVHVGDERACLTTGLAKLEEHLLMLDVSFDRRLRLVELAGGCLLLARRWLWAAGTKLSKGASIVDD